MIKPELDGDKYVKIKRKYLDNLLDRTHREGRGDMKGEVFAVLEEARFKPKTEVTVTYFQTKVQDL